MNPDELVGKALDVSGDLGVNNPAAVKLDAELSSPAFHSIIDDSQILDELPPYRAVISYLTAEEVTFELRRRTRF